MIEMFDGYEFIVCTKYRDSIPLSNLIVIADGADPHVVLDDETHVHHENEIRWDNRTDNLSIIDAKEHLKTHFDKNGLTPGSDHGDWWDAEDLHKMYWDDGMTQQEIADEFDVSQTAVSRAFNKLGIETRSPGQTSNEPWHNADTLRELYIENDMTQREISEELGTTPQTIRKWLKRTGVRQEKVNKRR